MAREIKKPAFVREKDLKEYDGDVIIDVTPRSEKKEVEEKSAPVDVIAADAAGEQVAVAAAQAAAAPGVRLLTFNAWFQKVTAKNPKVKLSYKEAIEAHCRAVGLPDQAPADAFDAALSHFGL